MSAFTDLYTPARFDADPNSQKGAKQLKHWLKVFTDFLQRCDRTNEEEGQETRVTNHLQLLFAYVSADVYEYIEDCRTYDEVVTKLKSVYIKTPNTIFARYKLATRKQQPGEVLEEFFQSLHLLSKDCQLRDVTAEEYRNELVRDAFINGIQSHSIRQRLLENNELSVDQAFEKACSLRTAQEHSEAYLNPNSAAIPSTSLSVTKGESSDKIAETVSACSKIYYFCGLSFHPKNRCPAREVFCYQCGRKGHFVMARAMRRLP